MLLISLLGGLCNERSALSGAVGADLTCCRQVTGCVTDPLGQVRWVLT